jgi:FHS family L-fucose permease-like MFS transporter
VTETRPNTSSSDAARFLAGAQGVFALGRFIGSFIMNYVRPRTVFLVFMTMCIVFIAPSITQRGNTGMSMLYLTLFFESIIFPTIVALGMRGLGRYSKKGSGYIVGGVCGGAVVPPLLFVASDAQGAKGRKAPTAMAMVVPLCFFVAAWSYALAVNFVPSYRDVADKFSTTEIGVVGAGAHAGADEESEGVVKGETGKGGVGTEERREAVVEPKI